MLEASNELAFALAKKYDPSDGEDTAKPCLHKIAKCVGDKCIERKVNEVAHSKNTITRRIEELPYDVYEQLKNHVHVCFFLRLVLDESAEICDVVQLGILIRRSDDNFNTFEEIIGLVSLVSLHGKTRGSDIFVDVWSCIESQQLNLLISCASVLGEHRQ